MGAVVGIDMQIRKGELQIQMEAVTFHYPSGITALKKISLYVSAGERVAVIGHNGSGKSTLAKQLNGLLLPSEGKTWIKGLDTSKQGVAKLAAKVALLFQNPDDQIFKRTVRDEVAFGPKNLGHNMEKVDRLVDDAMSLFDLLPFKNINPHDLGYSERKRVALASIIAMDTPIIVLDEPTAGLDAYEIKLFASALKKLKDENKTVLIITHDMDFVAENVPRILCLANGEKLFDGDSRKLFSDDKLLSHCGLRQSQVVRLSAHFQHHKLAMTPEEFIEESLISWHS